MPDKSADLCLLFTNPWLLTGVFTEVCTYCDILEVLCSIISYLITLSISLFLIASNYI